MKNLEQKIVNLHYIFNIVTKLDIWFGGNRLDFYMGLVLPENNLINYNLYPPDN